MASLLEERRRRWPVWVACLLLLPVAWMVALPLWAPRNRGWPFIYAAQPFGYFNGMALVLDLLVVGVLGFCTFALLERLLRRRVAASRGSTIFGLLAALGVLIGLWKLERTMAAPPRIDPVITVEEAAFWERAGLVYVPTSKADPWLIWVSVYLALGCAVFIIGTAVVRLFAHLVPIATVRGQAADGG